MGFAFAAETTECPGAFDFKQGDNEGNQFWKFVGGLLKTPSQEQVDCQQPKPILLDTGEMTVPNAWAPAILPIQIFQIGQVAIHNVPGEFTTMAGRRLQAVVEAVLNSGRKGQVHVVIAGLTNTYSGYITTFEEYEVQRYKGASTLYGPHTLSVYIQEFKKLATALISGERIPLGPPPPDLLDKQISMLPGVILDSTPAGVNFCDVSSDALPKSTFKLGDMVTATFWSACPRYYLLTEGTFALVEMLDKSKAWVPAYDDDDFNLRFNWLRPTQLTPESHATLEWRIPETAVSGV